jgi:hypothetical protein
VKAARLLLLLAIATAFAIVGSGYGTRFGWWDYRAGFTILRWSTYAGMTVAGIALVALLVPRLRAGRAIPLLSALVIAFAASAVPMSWLHLARAVPPINDITTDTADPPAFVALLPLRAKAPVPSLYPGAATAEAQRAGYPDLRPFLTTKPPREAFDQALAAARGMGWSIVAADPPAGRIEASATTPWFGFTDDVVVRVAPEGAGSRVDIRSVSRVGRSDLGANARRIREYLAALAG